MKPSEYLCYILALLASIWLAWWLFANVHQALGLVGIGLGLLLILWFLEAISEDLSNLGRKRRK